LDLATLPESLAMSIAIFVATCILGCGFLIVTLLQWTFGEKHRARKMTKRRIPRDSLRGVAVTPRSGEDAKRI
jgi:hypothetical protein